MKFSAISKAALLTAAMGLALATVPASAQDDESITVNAPRYHSSDNMRLNGPLERVSLSGVVHYDDLNLRTRRGAYALRMRVRDEAQEVCARIAEAYPVREAPGTSCYKDALNDGLVRANAAIRDARDDRYAD